MKIKNKSFKDKNKKWLKRHVDDEFVQKSISDNYRSRAAYKLVEIIEKYKILNEAKNVIDLGSAPGSWCQVLKNHGKSLNSIIAVDILEMEEIKDVTFYRSNFLSRRLEEELNSRSIPYKIYGGFRFFERSEVKDVIAYLRVAVNTSDDSAFERTINNPPRGLGEKTIQAIREYAKNNSLSMWDTINHMEKIGISGTRAINSLNSYKDIIKELIEKWAPGELDY